MSLSQGSSVSSMIENGSVDENGWKPQNQPIIHTRTSKAVAATSLSVMKVFNERRNSRLLFQLKEELV